MADQAAPNDRRMAEAVSEPLLEPSDDREVLRIPRIARAPREPREHRRDAVGDLESPFEAEIRAELAAHDTGVIVPVRPRWNEPRVPRVSVERTLGAAEAEQRRALTRAELREERVVLPIEVGAHETLHEAHDRTLRRIGEHQRSVDEHELVF